MVATPITATSRYIPPGTTRYYWVPTIANKAAPTRSELNAGSDLTAEISAVSGFATSSDQQDTPDLGSRFGVRSIPTLILLEGGREKDRVVGVRPAPALRAWIDSKLSPAAA